MNAPSPTVQGLLEDLLAEQESLDEVVAELTPAQWDLATPSPRWSITDQIGHLAYFDGDAALAINDPDAFAESARKIIEASLEGETAADDLTLDDFRALNAPQRLNAWRHNRSLLADAASTLGESDRVEWYGPSMSAKSFLTARLMEAWAHGVDVCDTLGVQREPTERLRHVAQIGYITRNWAYINRRLEPPTDEVVVELTAPSGERWIWGSPDAESSVRGPAVDFCLVVTQRRNVADTSLEVTGEAAGEWMTIAQAFAGPVSTGPAPKNP